IKMSQSVTIYDSGHRLKALSTDFGKALAPFSNIRPELKIYPDLKITNPALQLFGFARDQPFTDIADAIRMLQDRDYLILFRKVRELSFLDDPRKILLLVNLLEQAFNYGRLIIDDILLQIKIEDMQSDLIQIKRNAAKLVRDPRNDSIRGKVNYSFDELLSKLESSARMQAFLVDMGTTEAELKDRLVVRRNEDGSVHGEWKMS
ncbi:MAG: hypothetical protein ACREBU_15780, partial [Nitrososphaera sp.]